MNLNKKKLTEKEKMLKGLPYDASDKEINVCFNTNCVLLDCAKIKIFSS